MANNTKKNLIPIRNRSFLNKDFNDFRSQLLDYARTYFPDRIQDFSESSLGGLFLDLAAYVGDVNSFYLDHQFRELDPETAVERENIEQMARNSGVEIRGASPSIADVSFSINIPAEKFGTIYRPKNSALPIIRKNSSVTSDNDITFSLSEELDFSETNSEGDLTASKEIVSFDASGNPSVYKLTRVGACVSGIRKNETFVIPDDNVPFRTISLGSSDVSEVLDVRDLEGNVYHQVNFLTEDTVFAAVENIDDDNQLVKNNITVVPAPYRFVSETSIVTGLTTLRFGSGQADTLDGNIVPDPSELSLPLYGKKIFSRFTIDPNNLLKTKTLGISPRNTTISVQYRSGGGTDHNVSSNSINTPTGMFFSFPNGPTGSDALTVRSSVSVVNNKPASGGEESLTIDEIRGLIGSARNSQNRIVSKQDLLSRIYTMPSTFGTVFRAGVGPNDRNPLATNLYIVNRDDAGALVLSPDALKKNLSRYLDEFRLITDAIDILDAQVVNIGINFEVSVDPSFNSDAVLSRAIDKITNYMNVENFQIGQPVRLSDLTNLIYNTPGVLSVTEVSVNNIASNIGNRLYSSVVYNIPINTRKGLVIPPVGGIFEVKYPSFDIKGSVA